MKVSTIEFKKGNKTYNKDVMKVEYASDEEWQEHRSEGIGGSEDGILFGVGYITPLKWYRLRKGIEEDPNKDRGFVLNDPLMRGHIAEDFIAQMFSFNTGLTIIKESAPNIIYYKKGFEHRRVTPDRFGIIGGKTRTNTKDMSKRFVLECKSHAEPIKFNPVTGHFDYPIAWRLQVMKALGILGCPFGYIAWCNSRFEEEHELIEFNEQEYKDICDTDDLYFDMLKYDIEPEPTKISDITSKYPISEDKSVEFASETLEKLGKLREVNDQISELQKVKEGYEFDVKKEMEDCERAVDTEGKTLCTFKSNMEFCEAELAEKEPDEYKKYVKTSFDKDAFKKENPAKYRQYCTLKGKRVLRHSKT